MIHSKSKLKDIMANPDGYAILEKYVPGFENDPNLGRALQMDVRTLLKIQNYDKTIIDSLCADLDALRG